MDIKTWNEPPDHKTLSSWLFLLHFQVQKPKGMLQGDDGLGQGY